MSLVVAVLILLHHQLLVRNVERKGTNGDSETGESSLKTVEPGKLALVSPSISLGPGVTAHYGRYMVTIEF